MYHFLTIKFNEHVLIDEKDPFVLYSISVMTKFSKIDITKRYSHFVELNRELSKLVDDKLLRKVKGIHTLPKFPDSSLYYWNLDEDFIQGRKGELEHYSLSLVDLFHKIAMENYIQTDNIFTSHTEYERSKIFYFNFFYHFDQN